MTPDDRWRSRFPLRIALVFVLMTQGCAPAEAVIGGLGEQDASATPDAAFDAAADILDASSEPIDEATSDAADAAVEVLDQDVPDVEASAPDDAADDAPDGALACDAGGPPVIEAVSPQGLLGCPGELVALSASVCGDVSQWNWDFGGGMVPGTSSQANPQGRLQASGAFTGQVTGSGAGGLSDPQGFSYSAKPLASPGWSYHVLAPKPYRDPVFAVWGGRLALVLWDPVQGAILYARAAVANPSQPSDWSIHVIDASVPSQAMPYLAWLGGVPRVAWHDQVTQSLKVATASLDEPTATTDWSIQTVDDVGNPGRRSVLFELGGHLSIAYWSETSGELRMARCNSGFDCSSQAAWLIHVIASDAKPAEQNTGVAVRAAGGVAVAYWDSSIDVLRVALTSSDAPSAASDWDAVDVDPTFAAKSATLLERDGLLMAAYKNVVTGQVRFASATVQDPLSPTDWEAHDVPVTGSLQVRMELVGGRPTVASWGTALTVNRCQVSSPSAVTDWASIPISSTPGVFAMTAIGNQVALAWLSSNSEVQFAMSAPVDCW